MGIPYAPISPAYSLISSDFGKLRHIANLLTPGLVFAADGAAYARAIAAAVPPDVEVVVTKNPPPDRRATLFSALSDAAPTPAVDDAHAAVGPDTIAKFLFTSGSTGTPKAVINTQRMWCANQAMLRSALAYFEDEPPVIVDWAPWHHTAGGNHDVGLVLYNGGTLYIDDGKPLPGAIEETVRNLREVAPTWYFNVPKGYEALLPYLRGDARLCENFFSRLKVLWFAGAGIGQQVFDAMKDLSVKVCGEQILFLTGLGATETAPYAFGRTWDTEKAANVGLPPPGLEVKLVPMDDKYEARLRGPSITPGYWRDAALTAAAFDEEGFYRLGDAVRFHDPADPAKGLLFEGRIAEDFKLATGTWVRVGPLRTAFIAHFAPFVRDVVIAGPERDDLSALVFPDVDAGRRLVPHAASDMSAAALLDDPHVRREFAFLLGTARGPQHRQLEPHRPHGAARRAALARRRRDHRQGLDQPARRAAPPRRRGGCDVCGSGAGVGHCGRPSVDRRVARASLAKPISRIRTFRAMRSCPRCQTSTAGPRGQRRHVAMICVNAVPAPLPTLHRCSNLAPPPRNSAWPPTCPTI